MRDVNNIRVTPAMQVLSFIFIIAETNGKLGNRFGKPFKVIILNFPWLKANIETFTRFSQAWLLCSTLQFCYLHHFRTDMSFVVMSYAYDIHDI